MKQTTISLNPKVKKKLKDFKEKEGCTSFSDAINLLIEKNKDDNNK